MTGVDPVGLADLMVAAIAGALVVLFGALYAAVLAFAKLYRRRDLTLLAYLFFAALTASVGVLTQALHLAGVWHVLVGALLMGYLLVPRLIWKLSVATHAGAVDGAPSAAPAAVRAGGPSRFAVERLSAVKAGGDR